MRSASAAAQGAEEDSDLTHLIAEDDGEASGSGAEGDSEIDFNKLSAAIERFRPAEASWPIETASIETAASGLLLIAGLLLLMLAWKRRNNVRSRSLTADPV